MYYIASTSSIMYLVAIESSVLSSGDVEHRDLLLQQVKQR